MKITFCCTDTKAEPWLQGLAAALPGADITVWQPGAPPADLCQASALIQGVIQRARQCVTD